MSKISALDFVNNVERNRKSLVQHCLANGRIVLEGAPLDAIVAANNEINTGTTEGQCKVEFKNLDGEYFAPTQYVRVGESATLPSEIPTFDEEYLEFDYWATSGGDSLDNVQRDILCLPQYKTKYREDLGQRPTYLICYFDDTKLSTTLTTGSTHTNAYVDWGDGSEAQAITSSTISHTYAKAGLYTITIYGDRYSLSGSTNQGVFSSSSHNNVLLKAYLGDNATDDYKFQNSRSLTNVVLSSNATSTGPNLFYFCHSLTNVVIPSSVVSIGKTPFYSCKSLVNVIVPNTITSISETMFKDCLSLVTMVIPNSVTNIGASAFYFCHNLKNIVIPNGVVNIGASAFMSCYKLDSLVVPSGVESLLDTTFSSCYSLTNVVIPSSVVSMSGKVFAACPRLTNITLYSDFNCNALNLSPNNLSDDCLIDIANKLKDNSGNNVNTITFSLMFCQSRMNTIYLNEFGARVPYGTAGAVSILEFMQNKNWTVSFSD